MKNLLCFLLIVVTCSIVSCKKEDNGLDLDAERKFYLYFDYYNHDGVTPEVIFDPNKPHSPEIHIDPNAIEADTEGEDEVEVRFNNVSISDDSGRILEVNEIKAEYMRDGQWVTDTEFQYSYDPVEDLDIVLVVDASKSLEGDFPQVQSFVKNFVKDVCEGISGANVGIVDFSTNVNSLGLTNNLGIINSYVDSIKLDQYTSLYDAMEEGMDILEDGDGKSKVMLTFTDGNDNMANPNLTPESLREDLITMSGTKIASYMIGMGDNIDKNALLQLALNGGLAQFPLNINAAGGAFDDFSSTISTVHNLVYRRNRQKIYIEEPLELRYVLKAKYK